MTKPTHHRQNMQQLQTWRCRNRWHRHVFHLDSNMQQHKSHHLSFSQFFHCKLFSLMIHGQTRHGVYLDRLPCHSKYLEDCCRHFLRNQESHDQCPSRSSSLIFFLSFVSFFPCFSACFLNSSFFISTYFSCFVVFVFIEKTQTFD